MALTHLNYTTDVQMVEQRAANRSGRRGSRTLSDHLGRGARADQQVRLRRALRRAHRCQPPAEWRHRAFLRADTHERQLRGGSQDGGSDRRLRGEAGQGTRCRRRRQQGAARRAKRAAADDGNQSRGSDGRRHSRRGRNRRRVDEFGQHSRRPHPAGRPHRATNPARNPPVRQCDLRGRDDRAHAARDVKQRCRQTTGAGWSISADFGHA